MPSEKAPVGGISVKDHFEINLVPLTIGISHVFFKKIMAFCFPEKVTNNDPGSEEVPATKEKKKKGGNKNKKGIGAGAASFYVESPLNKVTDFAICSRLGYFFELFFNKYFTLATEKFEFFWGFFSKIVQKSD